MLCILTTGYAAYSQEASPPTYDELVSDLAYALETEADIELPLSRFIASGESSANREAFILAAEEFLLQLEGESYARLTSKLSRACHESGNYIRANDLLLDLQQQEPDPASYYGYVARYQYGRQLYGQGRTRESEAVLWDLWNSAASDDDRRRFYLGGQYTDIAASMELWDRVIGVASETVTLATETGHNRVLLPIYEDLAAAYVAQGRYQEALQTYATMKTLARELPTSALDAYSVANIDQRIARTQLLEDAANRNGEHVQAEEAQEAASAQQAHTGEQAHLRIAEETRDTHPDAGAPALEPLTGRDETGRAVREHSPSRPVDPSPYWQLFLFALGGMAIAIGFRYARKKR